MERLVPATPKSMKSTRSGTSQAGRGAYDLRPWRRCRLADSGTDPPFPARNGAPHQRRTGLRAAGHGGGGGRRWRIMTMTALLAAAPVAAPAQVAPGYSGQSGTLMLDASDSWFSIRQLGPCLARSKRLHAKALLSAEPASAEEDRQVRALIGRESACLRGANVLTFTRAHLRGTLAEALYRLEYRATPAPVPDWSRPVNDFEGFAQCVAAARPVDAHQLLATTRLGTEEARHILPACGDFGPAFRRASNSNEPSHMRRLWRALYIGEHQRRHCFAERPHDQRQVDGIEVEVPQCSTVLRCELQQGDTALAS